MRAVKLGVLGLLGVTRALVCPAGSEGLVDSDGTTSCEECPLGKFRSTGGSMRCSDCKSERWTTASTGSKGPEACVCKVGYYKAPTLDVDQPWKVFPPAVTIVDGEISYDCYECAEMVHRDGDGTDCTSIGIDLETIPVSPGYWRESNISRVVRHCPREEKACVGGTDSLCGESQAGPFCDLCAPGFYRAGGGNGICSQCVGDELITIALIFLLGVTACMLACCLCHLHTRRKARGRPLMSCASSGWASTLWPFFIQGIDPTRAEASFKSIITSVQMCRSVSIVNRIRLPPLFGAIMNVFGGITLMDFDIELLPVGCVFEVNYFGKLVSKTAMPAILIFLIIIIGNIASRVCKGKFILDLCNSTAFFLVFLLYPSASIAVFQFFTCESLNAVGETGYKYLFMDFSVDCNGVNYNHWKLFVVGMILIYPVGVPMTYTLMLFKDRHPLERLRLPEIEGNPEARKALQREIPFAVRMLTKRYRPGCYWWEVEESVFKIAVIGLPVIFMPGTVEQRSCMLVMIFIGSCLHVHHKPYAHAFNNGLQALIYFLVFTLIIAGHALEISPDNPVIDLWLTVLFLSCIALPISFELGLGKRMDSKLRKISRFLIALRTKATRLLDACLGSSTLDTEMQAQPAETAAAPSSDPLNA